MIGHLLLQSATDMAPFTDQMIKQGPVVMLLAIVAYMLYKKQVDQDKCMEEMREKHDADLKTWADKLETYMNDDRERLIKLVENNNTIIQDCNAIMKQLQNIINAKG